MIYRCPSECILGKCPSTIRAWGARSKTLKTQVIKSWGELTEDKRKAFFKKHTYTALEKIRHVKTYHVVSLLFKFKRLLMLCMCDPRCLNGLKFGSRLPCPSRRRLWSCFSSNFRRQSPAGLKNKEDQTILDRSFFSCFFVSNSNGLQPRRDRSPP